MSNTELTLFTKLIGVLTSSGKTISLINESVCGIMSEITQM